MKSFFSFTLGLESIRGKRRYGKRTKFDQRERLKPVHMNAKKSFMLFGNFILIHPCMWPSKYRVIQKNVGEPNVYKNSL